MTTKKGLTTCTLDEILFPVAVIDNPMNTNAEYSKIVTGVINNAEWDLNYCSPRYELVPNADIFPKVENILRANNIAFTAQYSHTNHVRFYGDFVIEDPRFAYKMHGTNDVINFKFSFQHSYNGITKYKGICGFHRLVCSNGLTVPVKEMNDYNLVLEGKHTATILNSLNQFDEIIQNLLTNLGTVSQSITQKYELLGGRWINNVDDRIKEVLSVNKIAMQENNKFNTLNNIKDRIMNEAKNTSLGYNGKVNDWLIYNGINSYVNDNTLNIAAPEKRRETDTNVLEYMLEYS